MRLKAGVIASVLGGGMLLSPAGAGAAAMTQRVASVPDTLPAGYTVVTSPFITANSGRTTFGSVSCPGSEVPTGGGPVIETSSVALGISSSFPLGQFWEVWINNTSGSSISFDVSAVCIDQPAGYEVVNSRTVTQAPISMRTISVRCPNTGAVAVGGGLENNSTNPTVSINSLAPLSLGKGWEGTLANGSAGNVKVGVMAICMPTPAGYVIKKKQRIALPAGTVTSAEVLCPSGTGPLSGGESAAPATATYTDITLNGNYPNGPDWGTFEANGTTSSQVGGVAAVCA